MFIINFLFKLICAKFYRIEKYIVSVGSHASVNVRVFFFWGGGMGGWWERLILKSITKEAEENKPNTVQRPCTTNNTVIQL